MTDFEPLETMLTLHADSSDRLVKKHLSHAIQRQLTLCLGNVPVLHSEECGLIRGGHRIDAIRHHRQRTGMSLASSKDEIDKWIAANKIST